MIQRIKQFLASIKCLRDYRHYRAYKKQYKRIYNQSVSNHVINKETEKLYMKKWRLISKFVSPYDYRVYSGYIGDDPNIVPENVLHDVIEPIFLPRAYQQFYNDKNMYDKILPQSYLAKSVFRCIDGICCGGGYDVLNQPNTLDIVSYCSDLERIIVKPTRDTGNGNRILLYQKQGSKYLPIGHEQELSVMNLKAYYDGNFVVQECLKQSEFTAQFNPTSVNTFRVFTYKSVKNNEVHVLGIVFRMGKQNAFVDNNHAGGRYIGILHDGSFANPCVFDQFGNTYTSFNDIDFSKSQFKVPNFQVVIDFSKSVAERIFHNRTLDLDVMIDYEGNPKLIEFNVDCCSPWLYQFTTGSLYREFTDEVIEYIKNQIS